MKINPIAQTNFQKSKVDKISVVASTLIGATLLGGANLLSIRSYPESTYQIKHNNLINMDYHTVGNLVEKFGIENLEITNRFDEGFEYKGKTGIFEKISGKIHKSKYNENYMIGTFKKEGLFSNKEYTFNLTYTPSKLKQFPHYKFDINLHPFDKPDEEIKVTIEQKYPSDRIFLNDEEMVERDIREEKNTALILAAIYLAGLGFLAANKDSD